MAFQDQFIAPLQDVDIFKTNEFQNRFSAFIDQAHLISLKDRFFLQQFLRIVLMALPDDYISSILKLIVEESSCRSMNFVWLMSRLRQNHLEMLFNFMLKRLVSKEFDSNCRELESFGANSPSRTVWNGLMLRFSNPTVISSVFSSEYLRRFVKLFSQHFVTRSNSNRYTMGLLFQEFVMNPEESEILVDYCCIETMRMLFRCNIEFLTWDLGQHLLGEIQGIPHPSMNSITDFFIDNIIVEDLENTAILSNSSLLQLDLQITEYHRETDNFSVEIYPTRSLFIDHYFESLTSELLLKIFHGDMTASFIMEMCTINELGEIRLERIHHIMCQVFCGQFCGCDQHQYCFIFNEQIPETITKRWYNWMSCIILYLLTIPINIEAVTQRYQHFHHMTINYLLYG